jgi:energy-coupling factor transport system permease protein
MLKDITIGQYIPKDSIIHALDPRTKILLTLIYIIVLFLIHNVLGYTLIGIFSIAVILLSRIPAKYVIKGLKPLLWIILFTFLLHIFMTKGEVVASLGPLKIYREGIRQGIFMALRILYLVLTTSLLTLTTSPIALTDGIERLLNPFRRIGVPAHELAMMMTIALRFIPTLLEETDKIMKAQMARGADFETGNIIQRAKSLVPLLVPLFVSAFRRADDLALAMEARCYRGGEKRTRMKQLRIHTRDYIAMLAMIMFSVVLIYVGR